MVWGTLLVALTAMSLIEHDYVRPLPGSRVVADEERDGELVVTYRDAGSRVRKTIPGRVYSIEYEIANEVTAEKVVDFFTDQAEGLDRGDVHRTTDNRLTFSFRRSDGGTTWCEVWATDGNYTLEIVDEAPEVLPEPEDASETASESGVKSAPESNRAPDPRPDRVVASLAFSEGTDALPPGAGAVLDDVATRLRHAPERRLEIRVRDDRSRHRAETLRSALLLFGIARERMTIVSIESDDAGDPNRIDLAMLP